MKQKYRIIFILLFLFFFTGPFLALFIKFFVEKNILTVEISEITRRIKLFANSLGLAAFVSLSSSVVGLIMGLNIWRQKGLLRLFFLLTVVSMLFLPSYIHAQSWIFLVDRVNTLLENLQINQIFFDGFLASWWVEMLSFLPICILFTYAGLCAINVHTLEAGLIYDSFWRVILKILLPLIKTPLTAGASLVFLLSFNDYNIPSIFKFNVYALEIFAEYSSTSSSVRALFLSLPVLLVTGVVTVWFLLWFRQRPFEGRWKGLYTDFNKFFGVFKYYEIAAFFIFMLQVLIPLIALSLESSHAVGIIDILTDSMHEILYSFMLSLFTSIILTPIALCVAFVLMKKNLISKVLWGASAIPLAVPASLSGIAFIQFFNNSVFQFAYGTWFMPVISNTIRFMPFSVFFIYTGLKQLDINLLDAVKVYQKNPFKRFLVFFHMTRAFLIANFFMTFSLVFGELGTTLMVVPPGYSTLTIKIYNYLHYGASDVVAVLCLFVYISAFLLAALIMLSYGLNKKYSFGEVNTNELN